MPNNNKHVILPILQLPTLPIIPSKRARISILAAPKLPPVSLPSRPVLSAFPAANRLADSQLNSRFGSLFQHQQRLDCHAVILPLYFQPQTRWQLRTFSSRFSSLYKHRSVILCGAKSIVPFCTRVTPNTPMLMQRHHRYPVVLAVPPTHGFQPAPFTRFHRATKCPAYQGFLSQAPNGGEEATGGKHAVIYRVG